MALDNKTSLLNTTLLSSSPRGAREHFLDSPFKHRSKDTSLDDSDQLSDGTPTPNSVVARASSSSSSQHHQSAVFCRRAPCRAKPGPVGAGGRAAEGAVQSQRARGGEEGGAVRAAQAHPGQHAAGVGRALQDHPAAAAGNHGRPRGKRLLSTKKKSSFNSFIPLLNRTF